MINHDKPRGLGKLGAISAICGQGRLVAGCSSLCWPLSTSFFIQKPIDDVSYSQSVIVRVRPCLGGEPFSQSPQETFQEPLADHRGLQRIFKHAVLGPWAQAKGMRFGRIQETQEESITGCKTKPCTEGLWDWGCPGNPRYFLLNYSGPLTKDLPILSKTRSLCHQESSKKATATQYLYIYMFQMALWYNKTIHNLRKQTFPSFLRCFGVTTDSQHSLRC